MEEQKIAMKELFEDVRAELHRKERDYSYDAGFSRREDIIRPVPAHLDVVCIDGEYALSVPWCGMYYEEAGWATVIPWKGYSSFMFKNRSITKKTKDSRIDGVMRAIGRTFDDNYGNSKLRQYVREYLCLYEKAHKAV